MKKINVAGIVSIAGGGLLYGYVEISNFMSKSSDLSHYAQRANVAHHQSLFDVLPKGNFDWIDSIPWKSVKDASEYVAHMPLWLLLIVIGVILLIIGGLFIKK